MSKAKFKRECPICLKVVSDTSESALKKKYAMHLTKHDPIYKGSKTNIRPSNISYDVDSSE